MAQASSHPLHCQSPRGLMNNRTCNRFVMHDFGKTLVLDRKIEPRINANGKRLAENLSLTQRVIHLISNTLQ
jgi:hypothetical protein